jgi:alanyl-tRNA synthetase
MVMQGVPTVFETDLFQPILNVIEKYASQDYPLKDFFWNKIENKTYSKEEVLKLNNLEITRRFRIIADHIRASVFLI